MVEYFAIAFAIFFYYLVYRAIKFVVLAALKYINNSTENSVAETGITVAENRRIEPSIDENSPVVLDDDLVVESGEFSGFMREALHLNKSNRPMAVRVISYKKLLKRQKARAIKIQRELDKNRIPAVINR